MKKLLISILIILLIVLAYFALFNGLAFGNVTILSVEQIIESNDELTNNIEQANSLLKKDYPTKREELSTSVTELLAKKEEYFSLAKISTEGEITKANTEETYLIEYLWARIGRHATSKGVLLKFDVNSGDAGEADLYNLAFNVKGEYTQIIQFISALENDDKLNFKIENFKMTPGDAALTATFNVRNVRIKSESITSAVSDQSLTEETTTHDNSTVTSDPSDNTNTTENNTQS